MPLTLDTPVAVSETITALEINSFAVDMERNEIHLSYDKGHMDGATFVPVQKDLLVTIPPSEFAESVMDADTIANDMPAGAVSVYGALKIALYSKLTEMTGLQGSIS